MNDILEKIKQTRAKQTSQSIRGSEVKSKILSAHCDAVKALLSGGDVLDVDPVNFTAQHVAALYYRMLQDYTGKPSFATSYETKPRSQQLWERVTNNINDSGRPPRHFMKAQFAYFHKQFGKAPQFKDLQTGAAAKRAYEYEGDVEKRIVANAQDADVSKAAIWTRCDKQVRNMCKAMGMTRSGFYKMFVLTGEMTFPNEFLNADPAYAKAVEDF